MISIKNYSFSYGKREVLSNINLEISAGEFISILGPNGSGKSTLMKSILGINFGFSDGEILIDGKRTEELNPKERAKKIAAVFQFSNPTFDYTVAELIEMGRYSYLSRFGGLGEKDREIIDEVMNLTELADFKDRSFKEISGGELQRVMIARAIAQEPQILILDEPVNHLDMKYEFSILKTLSNLNKSKKISIIAILHDVNLASIFSDNVVFIKNGKMGEKGKPGDLITSGNIKEIFDIDVDVNYRDNGIPYILPVFK